MIEPINRVVRVRCFGGPEGLEVVDAPMPTAGPGEVRVRVLASSLEYTDVPIRRHLYPQTMRLRPPFVPGYDLIGEIDQLGEGVADCGTTRECDLAGHRQSSKDHRLTPVTPRRLTCLARSN